ncbi:hypothetical protein [Yinghuangia sp. YIM S10712]|uniref:hypothetical protein n=1 Tax=Yinghuangia sp. YIM S10712 TaxID=3436930 RepID=UPI003F52E06B
MTDSTNSAARGAWPPRASGPATPSADIRAVIAEEIVLLGNLDVPPLHELDVRTAPRAVVRTALLRYVAARYEDDVELAERLRVEVENGHVAHLARVHEAHDQSNAVVRDQRKDWAKLPNFAELQDRRRTYPPTRTPIQTPNWPPVLIPGSGGRRLGEMNEGAA